MSWLGIRHTRPESPERTTSSSGSSARSGAPGDAPSAMSETPSMWLFARRDVSTATASSASSRRIVLRIRQQAHRAPSAVSVEASTMATTSPAESVSAYTLTDCHSASAANSVHRIHPSRSAEVVV